MLLLRDYRQTAVAAPNTRTAAANERQEKQQATQATANQSANSNRRRRDDDRTVSRQERQETRQNAWNDVQTQRGGRNEHLGVSRFTRIRGQHSKVKNC